MPAQTLDAFLRAARKGELAPVYYFHGGEDILKDESVRMLLDRVVEPGMRDFNFDLRSASGLDPEQLHVVCNTLPMMADRRMVVLRDVEAWGKKSKARQSLLAYLDRPAPETLLAIVQGSAEEAEDKEIAKRTVSVRCDPLPADRARKWAARHAAQFGVTFGEGAAEHLVASVGTDLGSLGSEIEKLGALPDTTDLSVERIGELVGVRRGETVFDWRDAVLDGRAGDAVTLLPRVLAQPGVSGVRLVMQLGATLVGIGIARGHWDTRKRGRALESAVFGTLMKVRPYGVGEWKTEAAAWARWAEHWPAPRVRNALRAAREADQALKDTTISDDRGILTDLVMRLAVESREAA
jgi:DNA polymerase III delta subunit